MGAANVTAIRGAGVTLQVAGDAFLSSPRCENANTRRAYAGVIDNVIRELGAARELAELVGDEIADALESLWATAAESTWNRNRAAISSWLTWCRDKQRWPTTALPGGCERSREHVDATRDLPRAAIDRQLSRRDVPLREKTLWRMLYETAARASEILALNVEDLDLDNRRRRSAPRAARSNGCTGAPAPRTCSHDCCAFQTHRAARAGRCSCLPAGRSRRAGPGRATSARRPATPASDMTAPGFC